MPSFVKIPPLNEEISRHAEWWTPGRITDRETITDNKVVYELSIGSKLGDLECP